MLIDNFPKLTEEEIASVEWQDDPDQYDIDLAKLCSRYKKCLVINPFLENRNSLYFIDSIPENNGECIIFYYKDQWLAKIFYRGWDLKKGYKICNIRPPQVVWRKNPEIDNSMTFVDSPINVYEPDPWDCCYTMTWYMDPQFNPTQDKIWVMTAEVVGLANKGVKDMGYLSPEVIIEYNSEIPNLEIDLDGNFPAYWDLIYDCVYQLDTKFCGIEIEPIWLIKISPAYRKTKDWKWIGIITPEPTIIYNPDIGRYDYEIDWSKIHFLDFEFENVFLLQRDHLLEDDSEIWALKLIWSGTNSGMKVIGHISPNFIVETNPDIIRNFVIEDYRIFLTDFGKIHTWYYDNSLTDNHKIWAQKIYLNSKGKILDRGTVKDSNNEKFDIVYISYDEKNAEENFNRLLVFAPDALRVKSVKGIANAHQKAAEISNSEMVWIVDGDAYISDDWDFEFRPSLFDRDCVFVFKSQNMLCDINYGHGGVKLFPRQKLLEFDVTDWGLDLTRKVGGNRLKVIDRVSNQTRFNTDSFATWRTVFRECVKLFINNNSMSKALLKKWSKPVAGQPYTAEVIHAYNYAKLFVKTHSEQTLNLINDRQWLASEYEKTFNARN